MKAKKFFFIIYFLFISSNLFSQKSFTLSGYVKSSSDGESLIGSTIYVDEIEGGVITNPYGFYSLTLEEGSYNIEYRYLGYITIKKQIILNKDQKLDIELISENIELENVLITSESENVNISSVEMSAFKLNIGKINEIPTFLGEVDIIKAMKF